MRYVRVNHENCVQYGRLEGETVTLLSGAPWLGGADCGQVPLAACELLAPVQPSKVVAVGLNYRAHAAELHDEVPAEPVLFLKPSTAVIGPGEPIRRPAMSRRVDFEAELAVVLGRPLKDAGEEEAMAAVFGFTCLNDVTARDLQRQDGQWTRAKGFDTFCPIGPWIETDLPYGDVEVTSRLNGDTRQRGRTAMFIHPLPKLLSYASQIMTLLPGDVLTTGTPEGIGPMLSGDEIEIEVQGIGVLRNPVQD